MKLTGCMLVCIGFSVVCLAQNVQNPQRYSYQIKGTVRDEHSQIMPHVSVCFVPAERPINGRIPCTKTKNDGTFLLTVNDVPDKYNICASTTETPFVFVGDTDPSHRVVCTKPMKFGAQDVTRKINLKFERKEKPGN